jgi:hypothetical protein
MPVISVAVSAISTPAAMPAATFPLVPSAVVTATKSTVRSGSGAPWTTWIRESSDGPS